MTDVTQLQASQAIIDRIQIEAEANTAADQGISIAGLTKAFETVYDTDIFSNDLQPEIQAATQQILNVLNSATISAADIDGISMAGLAKAWKILNTMNESLLGAVRVSFSGSVDINAAVRKVTHASTMLSGECTLAALARIVGEENLTAAVTMSGGAQLIALAKTLSHASVTLNAAGDIEAVATRIPASGPDWGRNVKILGDSRSASTTVIAPLINTARAGRTSNYNRASGPLGFALTEIDGRAELDPLENFAVGGYDLQEMIDNKLVDCLASPAHILVILGGCNDRGGANFTLTQSQDKMTYILDQARTPSAAHPNGHLIFLLDELPYEGLEEPQLSNHTGFRDWIRALDREHVHIVPSWESVATSSTANEFQPNMTVEASGSGLHPNVLGNAKIGTAIASVMNAVLPARTELLLASEGAKYKNNNPFMDGTGGTLTTQVTGQLPDGYVAQNQSWTNAQSPGSTATANCSIYVDGSGNRWLQIDFSGTPKANRALMWVYNALPILTEGAFVKGACLVWWDNLSNICGLTPELSNGSPTRKARALDYFGETRLLPASSVSAQSPSGIRLMRTPECEVPAGATSSRIQFLVTGGLLDVPLGGTVRIRQLTALEVKDYLVDDDGNYLLDENGNRLIVGEEVTDYLTDDAGNYLLDEDGNRLTVE